MTNEVHIHQNIVKEDLLSIMGGSHILLDDIAKFTIEALHLSWVFTINQAFIYFIINSIFPVSGIIKVHKCAITTN